MKKYLLALDISTSCTGWSLFDIETKKLFKAGAIKTPSDDPKSKKPPRFVDIFAKVDYVIVELVTVICKGLEIVEIAVEKALEKLSGGSNSKTIGMLIQFNFCIMYLLTRKFNARYSYYDVRAARKFVGIKVPKGADAKECVMAIIKPKYPDLGYEYVNRRKKLDEEGNEIPQPPKEQTWCFDMTDSIVIGETAIANIVQPDTCDTIESV